MANLIYSVIQDEVIDFLDNVLKVVAVEAPTGFPGTQRVKFCDNKWIKLYNKVTFGGNTIEVVKTNGEYQYDEDGFINFTVEAAEEEFFLATKPTLQRPRLLDGTLSNTKLEWSAFWKKDRQNNLPFIWIVSPTNEVHRNLDSGIGKESQLRIWFVYFSNWNKKNDYRQSKAIEPLFDLIKEFINTINRRADVFEGYDNFITEDYPKFGIEGPNGVETTIFDENLSAVKMDISLRLFSKYCEIC